MEVLWIFLLKLLTITLTESHQLTFYFTTVWMKNYPLLPEYRVVGSLDDIPILRYSRGTLQPLLPWMEGVGAQHWDSMAGIARHYELRHQHTIQRLKRPEDNSQNYVYQVRLRCEIFKDNTTFGEEEFGAHGRDFIFLDNTKQEFMVAVNDDEMATELAEEWNRRVDSVRKQFFFKDEACLQWLRMYLDHMKGHHPESVRPEVKVWGRQTHGVTRLHCLVYGFYPQDVDVKWVKNGTDHVTPYEVTPILPHPDGTGRITVSVEVPTREGDTYSCHVDHSSLEEALILEYNSLHKKGRNMNFRRIILSVASFVPIPVSLVAYLNNKDVLKSKPKKKWCIAVMALSYVVVMFVLQVFLTIIGRENKAYTEPD